VHDVVFWWSRRGEMRGKDGDLTVTFKGAKNTPRISNFIFQEDGIGNRLVPA